MSEDNKPQDENTAVNESKPTETEQEFNENVDTIVGRIVKLAPHKVMWKTEYGGITLSCFSGVISGRVSKDLKDIEKEQVVAGLRFKNIVFTEVEEKSEPAIITYDLSSEAVKARVFLDNPNDELFKKELESIRSSDFLNKCIAIYGSEYRNQPRMQMLKSRLDRV